MKTIALRVICCTILALLATALISCGSGQDRDGKRLDEYAVTVKMGGKLLKSYSMKDIEQMPYTSGSITCSGRNRIDFADHPRNISHEEHIYSLITCGLREGVSFGACSRHVCKLFTPTGLFRKTLATQLSCVSSFCWSTSAA